MDPFRDKLSSAIGELPGRVETMVDYATEIKPELVVVCDRTARPIGHVFNKLTEARGIELPIYYKRISTAIGSTTVLANHLDDIASRLRDVDNQRVMVIDDYVSKTASTAMMFRRAMQLHKLQTDIRWTTLTGKGTALNVVPHIGPAHAAPWASMPDLIGVEYEGTEMYKVDSPTSRNFYQALDESVESYLTAET